MKIQGTVTVFCYNFKISLSNIQEMQYSNHPEFFLVCFTYSVTSFCRREDERLQATGAELGDSVFNMTGENYN